MMISGLISLLIYLIVIGLVFYLIDYLLGLIPLPQPVHTIVRVLFALILIVIILQALGVIEAPLTLPRLTK